MSTAAAKNLIAKEIENFCKHGCSVICKEEFEKYVLKHNPLLRRDA